MEPFVERLPDVIYIKEVNFNHLFRFSGCMTCVARLQDLLDSLVHFPFLLDCIVDGLLLCVYVHGLIVCYLQGLGVGLIGIEFQWNWVVQNRIRHDDGCFGLL